MTSMLAAGSRVASVAPTTAPAVVATYLAEGGRSGYVQQKLSSFLRSGTASAGCAMPVGSPFG
jgi:hypothetical protein